MRERKGKLKWYEARWSNLEFFGPQWAAYLEHPRTKVREYRPRVGHYTKQRIRVTREAA